MTRAKETTPGITLAGLTPAPAQQWGGVRLIPLLREHTRHDLRLTRRNKTPASSTSATAPPTAPSCRTALSSTGRRRPAPRRRRRPAPWQQVHRQTPPDPDPPPHGQTRGPRQPALRPAAPGDGGFLALHFGGPDIAWSEYSREALTHGLSPRRERSVAGMWIDGLAEALRVFEIHDTQVGVLILVADALASAFVVPRPEDYRELHASLLSDFYGELLYHYGLLYPTIDRLDLQLDAAKIHTLDDLRAAVAAGRQQWHEHSQLFARGLLGRQTHWESVYRAGPFHLRRFLGDLHPEDEGHIGEAIHRDDGSLEYLKTNRLSAAQVRRAYLLQHLAAHEWHLGRCAEALGDTVTGLMQRLKNAGFAYLLKPHLLRGL